MACWDGEGTARGGGKNGERERGGESRHVGLSGRRGGWSVREALSMCAAVHGCGL